MNLDTLENKIGFQLGFLKHSDNVSAAWRGAGLSAPKPIRIT